MYLNNGFPSPQNNFSQATVLMWIEIPLPDDTSIDYLLASPHILLCSLSCMKEEGGLKLSFMASLSVYCIHLLLLGLFQSSV